MQRLTTFVTAKLQVKLKKAFNLKRVVDIPVFTANSELITVHAVRIKYEQILCEKCMF